MESKHGDIYTAHRDDYNWKAAPGTWTPGIDFRGPTCASCHMSGAGTVLTSHDVTERLSWELQAPLTVRPEDFKALPAQTKWDTERDKMKTVCGQCHSKSWVDDHYIKLDKVVEEYNEVYFKPAKKMVDDHYIKLDRVIEEYNEIYFKPAKKMLDELYEKGLLDKTKYFDERLEVEFYELWHHEGRRARMGAAMMAPDYSWWHGFYECKKRYNNFMEDARDLIEHNKKAYRAMDYPNATGSTEKPKEVFPDKK